MAAFEGSRSYPTTCGPERSANACPYVRSVMRTARLPRGVCVALMASQPLRNSQPLAATASGHLVDSWCCGKLGHKAGNFGQGDSENLPSIR